MSVDMLPGAHNLFDGMQTAVDDEKAKRFMKSIIFEGDVVAGRGALAGAARYDPEETQSQDGRGGAFMSSTYDQAGMQPAFMQDQVALDLDGFPLDHVFLDDYGLEEEDEVDIDGKPLFEDELANQAAEVQRKCKSTLTKA
ncbi:DNA repair protein rhp54 [Hordeum vulgare]|nr:DNA repair protein rhp54 [Hordeum vulgare]